MGEWRRQLWVLAIAGLLAGCPLFVGAERTPSSGRETAQDAATSPEELPGGEGSAPHADDSATPKPSAAIPVTPPNPPGPRMVLADAQLGYLTGSTGGILKGSVSAPDFLTGSTGGILTGSTGGILTGSTGGILTGSTGGLLTGSAGGIYRLAANVVRIANGFVYLTAPDERFYVTAERRLYGALTDANGNFELARPSSDSIVLNVLLSGNRRLTAIVPPGQDEALEVGFGTTLVTEYLRFKAAERRFTFKDVLTDPPAAASLERLNQLTSALVNSDAVLTLFRPEDLSIDNLPLLRHKYVVAFGTGTDHAISDEWTKLFKRLERDESAPDLGYRPLAVTTLYAAGKTETFIPPGNGTKAVAVDQAGTVYVADINAGAIHLWSRTAGGQVKRLFTASREFFHNLFGLALTLDGRVLIPADTGGFIAVYDPRGETVPLPFLDPEQPDRWTNPALLELTAPGAHSYDVAIDDLPEPGLYYSNPDCAPEDQTPCDVFYIARALSGTATSAVPLELRGMPGGLAYRRRQSDKAPLLYVGDLLQHVIGEFDLTARTKRRIAGKNPPIVGGEPSPGCYNRLDEGREAKDVYLRYPEDIAINRNGHVVFADSDNGLVRLVTASDAKPRIWTLAGIGHVADGSCGEVSPLSSFETGDFGEASHIWMGNPVGIAFDPDGNLIVSDEQTNRVRRIWTSFLD